MSSTNAEIEAFIRSKTVRDDPKKNNHEDYISQGWEALPPSVQAQMGNNPKEYDKVIGQFSIRNQLR